MAFPFPLSQTQLFALRAGVPHNGCVPNRAYFSIWLRGFTETSMLEHFGALLATVPFSKTRPGISSLLIRAVDSAEAPLEEHDLRAAPATVEGGITLARQHEHFDCSYEARTSWDLWTRDDGTLRARPQALEIICNGEEFDDGAFREAGHFQVDLGLEDWFIAQESGGDDAQKQRENARALQAWLQQLRTVLPVERCRLWSEGEEDFEARLDEAPVKS